MFDRVLNTPVNILATPNPVFLTVLQKNSSENLLFFSPSSKNKEKIHPEKISYTSVLQETKAPKKLLIFSQKKAFLIF